MVTSSDKTFVELCLRGQALACDIDEFIDQWHESSGTTPLHEYLGMTWLEYALWVKQPIAMGPILFARQEHVELKQALDFVQSEHLIAARAKSKEAKSLLQWLRDTGRVTK